MAHCWFKNKLGNWSRAQSSQFRILLAAPHVVETPRQARPCVLSLGPVLLPRARSCSLTARSCSLTAPSLLPSKRPCSLSRSKRVVSERKFGAYIIYIYSDNNPGGFYCFFPPPSSMAIPQHHNLDLIAERGEWNGREEDGIGWDRMGVIIHTYRVTR